MDPEVLQAKLDSLPETPGVYLLKDAQGKVLYIGKAKSLKHRVRSYFQSSRAFDHKTEVLKEHIRDIEYIVTDSEIEALLLESSLVKKGKPTFNVNLKDDKAFLHIKVIINEPRPEVFLTRRILNDRALYFGPYLPASLARKTIRLVNRYFLGPYRTASYSQEDYRQAIDQIILLLEGKNDQLLEELTEKMEQAAAAQHFEAAALYRDRIRVIEDLKEKQKMILSGVDDMDVFGYHREGVRLALQLFTLRGGRIVGKREFYWEDLEFFNPSQFLGGAIQQFYLSAGFVPNEIVLPAAIEDQELIEQWLTQTKGRRVYIRVPKRGEKHDLLMLVEHNAKIAFDNRFKILRADKQQVLESLQNSLDLPELPRRIEGFDVSNIQGAETVASLVVCENGLMQKNEYRKFRIKGVEGAHDFASIREAVYRRFRRVLEEGRPLPNLVLIDGGKGQLSFAHAALRELGLEDIPLAAIAKKEETLFVQGKRDPVVLPKTSTVLHLVQQIRDEAHRFAVTYHRKRRALRDFASELDQIPGVGEKRKKRLLLNFGSVDRIREATVEELAPFVGEKLARQIKQRL